MLYVFLVVQRRLVASVSVIVVVALQSSELRCQYCFPWLIQILYAWEKKLDKLTLLSTVIFIYIIIIIIIIIINYNSFQQEDKIRLYCKNHNSLQR